MTQICCFPFAVDTSEDLLVDIQRYAGFGRKYFKRYVLHSVSLGPILTAVARLDAGPPGMLMVSGSILTSGKTVFC